MAGSVFTKQDMQRADELLKDAEKHCSIFGFRCEMDLAAREELQRMLARVIARRTQEKPRPNSGFSPIAEALVESWVETCTAAGCELVISRPATWMLNGVFVRELRLTSIDPNPGYETRVVADLGSHRLCVDVPAVDPSLN